MIVGHVKRSAFARGAHQSTCATPEVQGCIEHPKRCATLGTSCGMEHRLQVVANDRLAVRHSKRCDWPHVCHNVYGQMRTARSGLVGLPARLWAWRHGDPHPLNGWADARTGRCVEAAEGAAHQGNQITSAPGAKSGTSSGRTNHDLRWIPVHKPSK